MARLELHMVPRRTAYGFTLIELLVVMAIVALLVTVATPRYFGSLERAKETVLRENLQMIRIMIDRYQSDLGQYPEALDELVSKQYLRAVPADPITESKDTWVFVPHPDPNVRGIFDVRSGAQGKSRSGISFGEM